MSFLNFYDADAALALIREFDEPTVAIIKHANPCGVAEGKNLVEAFKKAFACDSKSAFGAIVAVNRPFTADLAQTIDREKLFLEVIVAPSYEEKALLMLRQKKNLRLLEVGKIRKFSPEDSDLKRISGGYLLQDFDAKSVISSDLSCGITPRQTVGLALGRKDTKDLLFAWKVVKHVKSNAIVLAKSGATVGIGAGQMSRVDSVEIALKKAGSKAKGAVLASDAFFPFPDSVELASEHGISAIIQPGGSVNDEIVIKAAEKAKIPMVFTGVRAFRH
jgi:phosphoribosylaminoimidazolecarboxamide formyltransferase/IMP cyclohydrolase